MRGVVRPSQTVTFCPNSPELSNTAYDLTTGNHRWVPSARPKRHVLDVAREAGQIYGELGPRWAEGALFRQDGTRARGGAMSWAVAGEGGGGCCVVSRAGQTVVSWSRGAS